MFSLILHKDKILFCNTCSKVCFELVDGSWKKHSTLVKSRGSLPPPSTVTTNYGTFIFSGDTYEYLLNESSEWQIGKTTIPEGFRDGCVIALKSKPEILLIGGYNTWRRILSFNSPVSNSFICFNKIFRFYSDKFLEILQYC